MVRMPEMLLHLDAGCIVLRVVKRKDIGDGSSSCWSAMVVTAETKDKVDVLIWDDCHITPRD